MKNAGIIIQARMSSSRLPGKALMDLSGKPLLWHVVERSKKSKYAAKVIVATTKEASDNPISNFCKKYKIPCFRGSLDNVLERYYRTAKKHELDIIARITGDCPLIDPATIDRCFREFKRQKCDYISNVVPGKRTFPRGLDVEVFSFKALEKAHRKAIDTSEREHVTPHLWKNMGGDYKIGKTVLAPRNLNRNYRLTVDYAEDFSLINSVYNKFRNYKIVPTNKVIKFLDKNPQLALINTQCEKMHDSHAAINLIQKNTKQNET